MVDQSYEGVLLQELQHIMKLLKALEGSFSSVQEKYREDLAAVHAEEQALLGRAGVLNDYNALKSKRAELKKALESQEDALNDQRKQADLIKQYLMMRVRELHEVPETPDVESEGPDEDAEK